MPVCILHLLLIAIEPPTLTSFRHQLPTALIVNACFNLFHLVHIVLRLTLYNGSVVAEDAAISKFRQASIKTRKIISDTVDSITTNAHRFEPAALLMLACMFLEDFNQSRDLTSHSLRLARCFRVFFLIDAWTPLKLLFINCVGALVEISEALVLMASTIVLFACTAVVMWPANETAEGATYLYSMHRAIMSFT